MSGIRDTQGNVIYQTQQAILNNEYKAVEVICTLCGNVSFTIYFHRTKGGTFDREMIKFLLLNPEE